MYVGRQAGSATGESDLVTDGGTATAEGDSWFARFFGFGAHNTDLRTEILAGVTTFLSMS